MTLGHTMNAWSCPRVRTAVEPMRQTNDRRPAGYTTNTKRWVLSTSPCATPPAYSICRR